jgi:hypothetical protein
MYRQIIIKLNLELCWRQLKVCPKLVIFNAGFFLLPLFLLVRSDENSSIIENCSDSETDNVIYLTCPEPPSKKKPTDYFEPARMPNSLNQMPYFSFTLIIHPFALMFHQH